MLEFRFILDCEGLFMNKQKVKQLFKAIQNHDDTRLEGFIDEFGPEVSLAFLGKV